MPRRKRGRPRGSKNKTTKTRLDLGQVNLDLSPQMQKEILIVFLFAVAAIALLSFFDFAGYAGEYIDSALRAIFGFDRIIFPVVLLIIGFSLLYPEKITLKIKNYLGFATLVLSLNGLIHLLVLKDSLFENIERGGGYAGIALSAPIFSYFGFAVAILSLSALLIMSIIISFNTTLRALFTPIKIVFNLIKKISSYIKRKESNYSDFPDTSPNVEYAHAEKAGFKLLGLGKRKREDLSKEKNPSTTPVVAIKRKNYKTIDIPLNLLSSASTKPSAGDIRLNAEKIKKTLENFGIIVEMGPTTVGPTVTQYTFKPAEGINLSRITSLSNNLALSLAAQSIRMEAPIPGKSLVGVEVPNRTKSIVRLKEILESEEFKQKKSNMTIALGKDVSGHAWVDDLAKMPHLLVAGATGAGKSVGLFSIILSLLYQNSPNDLKFILIDPKRVEFPRLNDIPHLLTPVITDVQKIVNSLKWSVLEMERRLDLFAGEHKSNIAEYNRTAKERIPYLVIVIDELANLMTTHAASEVENCINILSAKARAAGIHLVLATQRPSVNVITGTIKANIPSRIAFTVTSIVDSRTILDSAGAEKLLGEGDLLFMSPKISKPKRLQSALVEKDEIKRVVDFLKQQDTPDYVDGITEKPSASSSIAFGVSGRGFNDFSEGGDTLLPNAKETIVQAGKASASLLQRRLKIGYARAARLLDILEEQQFIGPADGAKPREILAQSASEDLSGIPSPESIPQKLMEETPVEIDINEEDEEEEDFENNNEEYYDEREE